MTPPYGYVIAKEDIELYIWDGSMAKLPIKKDDKLDITYFEQDGTLGLTPQNSNDKVELCCSTKEREHFEEFWKN